MAGWRSELHRAQARSSGVGWIIAGLAVLVLDATMLVFFRLMGAMPISRIFDLAMGTMLGVAPAMLLAGAAQVVTGRTLDEPPDRRVAFVAGFLAAILVWSVALAWIVYGGALLT